MNALRRSKLLVLVRVSFSTLLYILKQKGQFYSEREAELSDTVLWFKTVVSQGTNFFCLGELYSIHTTDFL